MPTPKRIRMHDSMHSERLRSSLRAALGRGEIPHKYHYQSPLQARRWLAVHEALSPARTDPGVLAAYERAFREVAASVPPGPVHVVGLGCGGGQKDLALLQALGQGGHETVYTPVDGSEALVVRSGTLARKHGFHHPENQNPGWGLVCDLEQADDLETWIASIHPKDHALLLTFFGMLPNFEPEPILSRVRRWMGAGGSILVSANLAPGPDYREGVEQVLPLYRNEPTESWLQTLLWEAGLPPDAGSISWTIEDCPQDSNLLRIQATYTFDQSGEFRVNGVTVSFQEGQRLRLFFSYRHTPDRLEQLLAGKGIEPAGSWVSPSGEEGVFFGRGMNQRLQSPSALTKSD